MQYIVWSFDLLNLDTYIILAVYLRQRWMNIKTYTQNTKRRIVSRDICYDLNRHKQFPA